MDTRVTFLQEMFVFHYISHQNKCQIFAVPPLLGESQSCVVVENPLDVERDLDEDTRLVPPAHRAEDDDPAKIVVTLSLAGQGRTSV